MPFFSYTITSPTSAESVTKDTNGIDAVKQVTLKIRTMGTATYVALGGSASQDRRLLSDGDFFSISPAPANKTINLSEVFIISDTADAVIEVFGEV